MTVITVPAGCGRKATSLMHLAETGAGMLEPARWNSRFGTFFKAYLRLRTWAGAATQPAPIMIATLGRARRQ